MQEEFTNKIADLMVFLASAKESLGLDPTFFTEWLNNWWISHDGGDRELRNLVRWGFAVRGNWQSGAIAIRQIANKKQMYLYLPSQYPTVVPIYRVSWALSEFQEEILVATAYTEKPNTEVLEDATKLYEFVTTKGIPSLEIEVGYFLFACAIANSSHLLNVASNPFPASSSQTPSFCLAFCISSEYPTLM